MSDIDDMDLEHLMRLEEYKYDKAYRKAVDDMIRV